FPRRRQRKKAPRRSQRRFQESQDFFRLQAAGEDGLSENLEDLRRNQLAAWRGRPPRRIFSITVCIRTQFLPCRPGWSRACPERPQGVEWAFRPASKLAPCNCHPEQHSCLPEARRAEALSEVEGATVRERSERGRECAAGGLGF